MTFTALIVSPFAVRLAIGTPAPITPKVSAPLVVAESALPPFTVPVVSAPAPEVRVVLLPSVVAPSCSAVPVVAMAPLVVVAGAVAVRPPANVLVPPPCPMVSVPVLLNVLAPLTVFVPPVSATLNKVAAVEMLAASRFPVTVTLPPVLLSVSAPSPAAEAIVSVPVPWIVSAFVLPVTAPVVVIAALPPLSVTLLPSETAPRLIAALVVLIVPRRSVEEGAVAVKPAPKLLVLPPFVPIRRVPLLLNVPVPLTVFVPPFSETLKAAADALTLAASRFPVTVAVPLVLLKVNAPTPVVEAIVSVPEPTIVSAFVPPVTTPVVIVPEPLFSVVALASVTAPVLRDWLVVAIVPLNVRVPPTPVIFKPPA